MNFDEKQWVAQQGALVLGHADVWFPLAIIKCMSFFTLPLALKLGIRTEATTKK